MPKTIQTVGYIGVDAGMCMVGDPCYVIDGKLGKMEWSQFLAEHCPEEKFPIWPIPHPAKHPDFALAVVVGGFGGDGVFPVMVEVGRDGQVKKLIVDFDGKDD